MAMLPDPNRQLLQDLPVLENLDQYREIDSLDFLRLAAHEKLFPENGGGDADSNADADADAREEAESLAQRRERIKNMSPAQKDQLLNRQQQFLKLEPAEQQRVRQLHEQLQRDPDAGKLRDVLGHYCQWLAVLPAYRQAELKEVPPAQRVRQIKVIEAMQAVAAARQHNAEDHPALPRQIDRRWPPYEPLARYFEFQLGDQQRDRLMRLPGEEMQQRVRKLFEQRQQQQRLRAAFERSQHGKKPAAAPAAAGKADGRKDGEEIDL